MALAPYTVDNSKDISELRSRISLILAQFRSQSNFYDKSLLRALHQEARLVVLHQMKGWIRSAVKTYRDYFADGAEINPLKVKPRLIQVAEDQQHDLFRLARLTWSLPYTQGFGRRLRFLVMDESNGKLIGLIGLHSPPIDLAPRDRLFSYPPGRKTELINQTMDIYTLGAVPPYSFLLGGKLVALLAATKEVQQAYKTKYSNRKTLISGRQISSELVALTTTSAYGRSSIYNRLKYNGRFIAEPIGYTRGFGTFHLLPFYSELRSMLPPEMNTLRSGFSEGKSVGPRPKWQEVDHVLSILGLSPKEVRQHGVKRQVFLYRLIENLEGFMAGEVLQPHSSTLSSETLANYWKERWLIPRSQRLHDWRSFKKDDFLYTLITEAESGQ